jgi:hypothetical protein
MDGASYRDAEFISEVAEDVLGVLKKSHFFRRLEDRFCAPQSSGIPLQCSHSFVLSIQVLRELGMDAQDIGDVLAVLRFRGASCDCEVLHNVADRTGLKMPFWNPKATDPLLDGHCASPYVN